MIAITDVFKSINQEIKTIFPNAKVHKERIKNLKTPALSVELISYRTPQHSKNIINKKIDLDIIYFAKEGRVIEALEASEKLMSAFSMGIFVRKKDEKGLVDKRFIHCLKTPEYKLVDDDLHFLVTFEYADEFSHIYIADDGKAYEFPKANVGILDNNSIGGKVDKNNPIASGEDKGKDNADIHENTSNIVENSSEKTNVGKEFVEDIRFKDEKQKKEYYKEGLQMMEHLKLEYTM